MILVGADVACVYRCVRRPWK